VVDDRTGKVVSYQDSFADAEEYVRDANAAEPLRFPLSAIFRGYVQAREQGYRGSARQWMRETGVEVDTSRRGRWEAEPIESATARQLLEGNDNPNFYHRADHLRDTKAQGHSEILRAYANTLELRTKSEHFDSNKTYYRQWVLFKDFYAIAKDKKIPLEDAIDYSLNYGDVHVRCSCFTGDTKVRLLDGRNLSFDDIGREFGEDNFFWVLSSDQNGDPVPAKARFLGEVSRVNKLAVVSLDNGEVVRCTLDHPFRLRDGSYCIAEELKAGDSLMPLYLRHYYPYCVGYNHKVEAVDFIDVDDTPVFCLEVPEYNNFALSAGVFVHNCPSQLYHGFSYMGDQLQYLYGLPREKRFPKIRNPYLINDTCKHTHMALEEILGSKEKIVSMFSEYYKRLPEVPENALIAIPAPKAAGAEPSKPEVDTFKETGDVEVTLGETAEDEQGVEPEVISTEDPTEPGTVYVDTKLAEESLPEDQRVKYAGDEGSGGGEAETKSDDSIPVAGAVSDEEVNALAEEIDQTPVTPQSDDERFSTEWAWQSMRRRDVGW
jgi:hypothetical protein